MNIVTDKELQLVEHLFQQNDFAEINSVTPSLLKTLYDNIPDNKRISYGRYHTIKVLGKVYLEQLTKHNNDCLELVEFIIQHNTDHNTIGVALGMLSSDKSISFDQKKLLFRTAAASDHWDVREFAQGLFRKVIKQHKNDAHNWLLECVKSTNPNLRRFVSETLRPVQENRWMTKEPDYSLSILQHLFDESNAYPRTSVGNNLSDLSRYIPEQIFDIIDSLVKSGNKHSYWIAYRACRNLVKTEPERVLDVLGTDEYKYKDRYFKRESK